jgi:diaminohydroxyphosphoribosylaminopyrimidine deaminase / 5-amino-6-(5-phosphoribosylamino)uracil reductase
MAGADGGAARIPGDPDADRHWLNVAIDLSGKCPVSGSAFSVGAVLVSAAGDPIATGYSRETNPHDHAEEVALRRAAGVEHGAPTLGAETLSDDATPSDATLTEATLAKATLAKATLAKATLAKATLAKATLAKATLAKATLYSSLEPCLRRGSRPVSCSELIAQSGLRRVVIAWLEPPVFEPGGGAAWLTARNVAVIELPDLAERAKSPNAHLLSP